jgi:hypothetical protein
MHRLSTALKFCLALPVYQAINLTTYANAQQGWVAKIGMGAVMLPIFVISTTCWLMVWAMVVWLVFHLV